MPAFEIEPHDHADKHFNIFGPGDLLLMVYYDDVNHFVVDALAEELVEVLNKEDGVRWYEAEQRGDARAREYYGYGEDF